MIFAILKEAIRFYHISSVLKLPGVKGVLAHRPQTNVVYNI